MKLKELKSKSQLPKPIYIFKPYVILNSDGVILHACDFDDMLSLTTRYGDYYANCPVDIRKYDLFMNDNTKI
jgi:hypothetical protein